MVCLQGSLFAQSTELRPRKLGRAFGLEHIDLGSTAWLDLQRNWVEGADDLFSQLVNEVPWEAERRAMYDKVVEVPRLQAFYPPTRPLANQTLGELKDALSDFYSETLGEPFASVGLCFYRDGHDSVAFHGDTIGRGGVEDTVVAIVSLGAERLFCLREEIEKEYEERDIVIFEDRPPSRRRQTSKFLLGSGDLLVMGGSCQRTFEHGIPKAHGIFGPRISVQFRASGVR